MNLDNLNSVKEEAIDKATQIIKRLSKQVKVQSAQIIQLNQTNSDLEINKQNLQDDQSQRTLLLQQKVDALIDENNNLKQNQQLKKKQQKSIDLSTPQANKNQAQRMDTSFEQGSKKKMSTPQVHKSGKSYFLSNISFNAVLNEVRSKKNVEANSFAYFQQRNKSDTLVQVLKPKKSVENMTNHKVDMNMESQKMYIEDLLSDIDNKSHLIRDQQRDLKQYQEIQLQKEIQSMKDDNQSLMKREFDTIITIVCKSLQELTNLYRQIQIEELQNDLDNLQEPMSFSSTKSVINYQIGIVQNITPKVINHYIDANERYQKQLSEVQVLKLVLDKEVIDLQNELIQLGTQIELGEKLLQSQGEQILILTKRHEQEIHLLESQIKQSKQETLQLNSDRLDLSEQRNNMRLQFQNQELTRTIIQIQNELIEKEAEGSIKQQELLYEIQSLKQTNQANVSQMHSLKNFIDTIDRESQDSIQYTQRDTQNQNQPNSATLNQLTYSGSSSNSKKKYKNGNQKQLCQKFCIQKQDVIINQTLILQIPIIFYELCIMLFGLIINQSNNERPHSRILQIRSFLESDTYNFSDPVNMVAKEAINSLNDSGATQLLRDLCSIDKNLEQEFDKDVYKVFLQINKIGETYLDMKNKPKQYFTQLMELKFITAHTIEKRSQKCQKLQHKINEALSIGTQFSIRNNRRLVVGPLEEIKSDSHLVMQVLRGKLALIQEKFMNLEIPIQSKVQVKYFKQIKEEYIHLKTTVQLFDILHVSNITPQVISYTNTCILELIEIIIKLQTINKNVMQLTSQESRIKTDLSGPNTFLSEQLLEVCSYQMAFNILSDKD